MHFANTRAARHLARGDDIAKLEGVKARGVITSLDPPMGA
jgi:hypothetical protein